MKKWIAVIIAITFVLSGAAAWLIKTNEEPERYAQASWAVEYETVEEMAADSDLIIEGTVVEQTTQLWGGLVFTVSTVEITKMIDGEINSGFIDSNSTKIDVVQTGGVYREYSSRLIEDTPLLKKNDHYLLYLSFSTSEYGDLYSIAGGNQGMAEIKKDLLKGEKYVGYGGGGRRILGEPLKEVVPFADYLLQQGKK